MNPRLSIIIPTYNSVKTLVNTLDSIITQTFSDFEVLIIDNCSVDGTLDLVNNYVSLHNNFRIISESDNGIYDAMNKGIKLAKGEWLYFLGSDDRILKNDVLKEIFNSRFDKTDIIYGNVISERFKGRYDGEFTLEKLLLKNICHQAIFINRAVFNKIGLFNIKYHSHADWDHNLKWFLNPKIRKKYINIDIAEYADGGISSRFPDIYFASDKNSRIIRYGFLSLPPEILLKLSGEEYSKARAAKFIGKAILYKAINFYSRICLKFQ